MKITTKKIIQFFWKHIRRYKLISTVMLISIIFAVVIGMIVPIFYKEFLNTAIGEGTKDEIAGELFKIIFIILGVNLLSEAFWRVCGFLNNRFQPRVMSNIANECFDSLHKHSYNFFNNSFSGALVKRVNRMVNAFEGIADRIYWDSIPIVLRVLVVFAVLTYVHPLLGGIIFVWVAIFVILSWIIGKYKIKYEVKRARMDTKVTAALADTITNNANIKLFSGLDFENGKFQKITKKWYERIKKAWDIDSIIVAMQALLMTILEITIMSVAILLWKEDMLTAGDFFLIQTYLWDIFLNLWEFGRILRSFYDHFANAEEMMIILNMPHEVKDKNNAKILQVNEGKVEFKNVIFSYSKSDSIIKNLSFTARPGQKIALIGPSGGGKTTVTKLLLRLFDIQKGKILVDGQNIADVTQDSLRKGISLVPQDPILFHRSLLENIRYGKRNASKKEVIAAAKMAHCHEFISRFPNGYDTHVGERGVKLSGGERQRVAIARAILSNTKILVLDEATSQLDSESEKLIQEALKNLIKNKTTFIIAHRLSTIMEADRVFVLKEGRIIEEGKHADLVGKTGGLYKKLWDLQIGGYLET